MKLIKGENLNPSQVKEVKTAFIYRWTVENIQRAKPLYNGLGHPTMEPIPDSQWIREHAFYIRKDGHLSDKPHHCEPAYMVK